MAALGAVAGVLCLVLSVAIVSAAPAAFGTSPGPATSPSEPATPTVLSPAPSAGSNVAAAPDAAPVLSAPGDTPSVVSLSWQDGTADTFENYTLEEASQASGWALSTVAVFTSDTTTSYAVTGVSPSVDYDWQVVEHYEDCVLVFCTQDTATTNLLNLTQPAVAFLNDTGLTSTNVDLHWTNNATYGGLVSFASYQVYENANGTGSTLIATITSAGTRSYSQTLTSGGGYSFYVETSDCTAGCGGGSPTVSTTESNVLTVGALESLAVNVFAQHGTIDLGQSDFFTCTASGGESPYHYQWQFGVSGTYAAGSNSESATFNATGTQVAYCKVTDAEPSSETNTADVLVNPALVVVASVNRSAADEGQKVKFTCYGVGGTTPYTLLWSFGDGDTSSAGNQTHTYLLAGDDAPTCQVSDDVGSVLAPSFALVVSPPLTTTANASWSAAAPGTALTFTANPVNGSGTYSAYDWTFGPGVTSAGRQVAHAFTTLGEQTVDLSVSDSNGATASTSVVVDISPLTVLVAPTATSVTSGSSVTFTATASGGAGGPYTFNWSFGDGEYASGQTVHHSYTATGTVVPMLRVTDRLGAVNTTSIDSIHVSAVPAPLAGFADLLILGIAIVVAIIVGLVVLSRRRAAESAELEASSAYVPPTDPKKTIRGRKVCPSCGSTNLPIRTTCSHCGKPLPRSPS
jgi:PKD domain